MLKSPFLVILAALLVTGCCAASSQRRLVHQATHDALTGLANRRLFEDRVAASPARPGIGRRTPPTSR